MYLQRALGVWETPASQFTESFIRSLTNFLIQNERKNNLEIIYIVSALFNTTWFQNNISGNGPRKKINLWRNTLYSVDLLANGYLTKGSPRDLFTSDYFVSTLVGHKNHRKQCFCSYLKKKNSFDIPIAFISLMHSFIFFLNIKIPLIENIHTLHERAIRALGGK